MFSTAQAGAGSAAAVWDPTTGQITDVSLTWQRDVYCAGHSLLPDGRVLVTGGHVYNAPGTGNGPANTDVFDPSTGTWTSGPLMSEGRWYPSNVQLANGKTLIFGGKITSKLNAVSVDSYDPVSGTITRLPASANKSMGNYPKLHLLPDGRIVWTNKATTEFFNPATNTWSNGPTTVFGSRGESGNSVLLPGLTKVLQVGGVDSGSGHTATAEIADFSSPTPTWRATAPMNAARGWANAVLLADGNVLTVGGATSGMFTGPVRAAELFDSTTETWTTMASQVAERMYHSVALLLPDGRVLSAGQNLGSSYSFRAEVYSPPYLFRGPRPTITGAPDSVGYGQPFTISTPDADGIQRVALVKLGSPTHATDFEQRYVDLTFSPSGGGTLTAAAPANGNIAPPGSYMLFIVNGAGVPSVASIVHVP